MNADPQDRQPKSRLVLRGCVDHVIILDGTLSSLAAGQESNAGLLFRLLQRLPARYLSLYYQPGLQWAGWRRAVELAEGKGLDGQIQRAYGHLASRYREGDRIFLFGYSRGAYAVRSLAGVIDRVGLLRREQATERGLEVVYRRYRAANADPTAAAAFRARFCHPQAPVHLVGVWDTVKALGLRLPLLWLLTQKRHAFHDHRLGASIRAGLHALALHETRDAFAPVLWQTDGTSTARVRQMWFRGAHADIGGHVGDFSAARPLANIPFVWMLEEAEACGLPLPEGWRAAFPCDPAAPMVGTRRGWSRLFLLRRARAVGLDPSEAVHDTAGLVRPLRP